MSHVIFGCLWNFLPLGPFRKPFYWITCIPYRLQIRRAMRKFLIPIIEERMTQKEQGIITEDEKPLDTIQLMVDMPPAAPNEVDSFRHAIRILHLHFASTGSSISLLHHTIWQLLQDPECIEPIRAEIKDVRERFGAWDSKDTLNHLHLLDSFIREVLRVHVPSARVSTKLVKEMVLSVLMMFSSRFTSNGTQRACYLTRRLPARTGSTNCFPRTIRPLRPAKLRGSA